MCTHLRIAIGLLIGGMAISITNPAFAGERERRVTEDLLKKGYRFEQSNFYDLLRMIEHGETWVEGEPGIPYVNLRRFRPFNEEYALAIVTALDRLVEGGRYQSSHAQLITGLMNAPIMFASVLARLAVILPQLPASDGKRVLAKMLARSEPYFELAIGSLKSVLRSQVANNHVRVLAALDLFEFGIRSPEADQYLRAQLKDAPAARLIFDQLSEASLNGMTDEVLTALKGALEHFKGMERVRLTDRLVRLFQIRAENVCAKRL